MVVITKQKIDSYECLDEECNADEQSLYACEDAIACWKSTTHDEYGTIYNNRGCIRNADHMQFMCNERRRMPGNSPLDYRFRVECCTRGMWNGGAFPLLPSPSNNLSDAGQGVGLLVLTALVLVPLLILGLIIFFRAAVASGKLAPPSRDIQMHSKMYRQYPRNARDTR